MGKPVNNPIRQNQACGRFKKYFLRMYVYLLSFKTTNLSSYELKSKTSFECLEFFKDVLIQACFYAIKQYVNDTWPTFEL